MEFFTLTGRGPTGPTTGPRIPVANKGLIIGIPYTKYVSCHPGHEQTRILGGFGRGVDPTDARMHLTSIHHPHGTNGIVY